MSVLSPLLITQLAIATAIFYYLHSVSWLDAGILDNTPVVLIVSLFTIFHFILEDFSKYIVHRLMHKWPVLWALHKVHHSATCLTPMTVFRTHPLEGVIFSIRGSLTQAISISLFVFFFGSNVDIATILGANIFIFAFNVAGSNLRHSHIDISYWKWLERLIISPAQHQVHHSALKQHHDKNFGASLALWDWLFGSLHHFKALEKDFPNFKFHIALSEPNKEDEWKVKEGLEGKGDGFVGFVHQIELKRALRFISDRKGVINYFTLSRVNSANCWRLVLCKRFMTWQITTIHPKNTTQ